MFTSLQAWILLNKWWWHRNVVYLAQYDWLWLVYKYLKRSVRIFQNDPLNFWEYFTMSRHVRHNALSLTLTFNGAFTDSCKPWQLIFSISLLLLRHGVIWHCHLPLQLNLVSRSCINPGSLYSKWAHFFYGAHYHDEI